MSNFKFYKHAVADGYAVRYAGHDTTITKEEATDIISKGQGFFKTNKPIKNMAELNANIK